MPKRTLLLLPLLLFACEQQPVAPSTDDGRTLLATDLVARDDSLSKGAYASWQDGGLSYWVFVSETLMPGTGTEVWLSYGAYDPMTGNYAFWGSGVISPRDVTGSGQGTLRLRTTTAPSAYPDFTLFNHAGGPIEIVWRAVPATVWRWHEVGSVEVGNLVIKYVTGSTTRDATITGALLGDEIPSAAAASLWQNVSHSMVLQPGP